MFDAAIVIIMVIVVMSRWTSFVMIRLENFLLWLFFGTIDKNYTLFNLRNNHRLFLFAYPGEIENEGARCRS
jgi:hypothetical protein